MTALSKKLYQEAKNILPAGVSSPVRAFLNVKSEPIFIQKGQGPYLIDVDNKKYIDYVCSWGPLILGHAHPYVVEKVAAALHNGFSFGAATQIELQLAQKVQEYLPSMEMLRFVSSGTEAAMSAIRLARGFTARDKIIKLSGCYHGHADSLLVAAGSGALTGGVPNSAGVPASVASHTLIGNYNDLKSISALFAHHPHDIAAIIVEPIAANAGLILPEPEFLAGLRKLCDEYQALLIFDEVITGFRLGKNGAQAYFNIKPDLTILGKILGGGLPAAAFGGKAKIMQCIAPLGPVYQAGTLSGNPIAMTAGLATLELLDQPNFYLNLKNLTEKLTAGLNEIATQLDFPFHAQNIESIFGLFFTDKKNIRFEKDVSACNKEHFTTFFHGMLKEGIYLAPSSYEVGFVSAAHSNNEIEFTLDAFLKVLHSMRQKETTACYG